MQHGTAPDQRLIAGIEQANGDQLYAKRLERLDAVIADDAWRLASVEHQRDIRAIDVGIEHANFVAHTLESQSKIHGDGRLAHTAFARTDGNDAVNPGKGLRRGRHCAGMLMMSAHCFDYRGLCVERPWRIELLSYLLIIRVGENHRGCPIRV